LPALSLFPGHTPAQLARCAAQDASLPTLEEAERTYIRLAIEASHGHRGNAAEILGISERNLYRKLRERGLLS